MKENKVNVKTANYLFQEYLNDDFDSRDFKLAFLAINNIRLYYCTNLQTKTNLIDMLVNSTYNILFNYIHHQSVMSCIFDR